MHDYWLDADSLIQSKNHAYSLETFPVVWHFLEQQIDSGVVAICHQVGEELLNGKDALKDWARKLRDKGVFVMPDSETFAALARVSNYVNGHYVPHQAADFLAGADPWVIANAMAHGGTIVSHEAPDTHQNPNKREAKVPDVAAHFGVQTIHIKELFPALGAKFG